MSELKMEPWRANVLIIYSGRDMDVMDMLKNHLRSLVRIDYVSHIWYSGLIAQDFTWDDTVWAHLTLADIVLILVNKDVLRSPVLEDGKMSKAIQLHFSGKKLVIPVVTYDCDWKASVLGRLYPIPRNAKPIKSRYWREREKPYQIVASELKKIILANRTELEIKNREGLKTISKTPPPVNEDFILLNKNLGAAQEQLRMQHYVLEELYETLKSRIKKIEQQLKPEQEDREKLIKVFGKDDPAVRILDQKMDQLYMVLREYHFMKDHYDELLKTLKPYYADKLEEGNDYTFLV